MLPFLEQGQWLSRACSLAGASLLGTFRSISAVFESVRANVRMPLELGLRSIRCEPPQPGEALSRGYIGLMLLGATVVVGVDAMIDPSVVLHPWRTAEGSTRVRRAGAEDQLAAGPAQANSMRSCWGAAESTYIDQRDFTPLRIFQLRHRWDAASQNIRNISTTSRASTDIHRTLSSGVNFSAARKIALVGHGGRRKSIHRTFGDTTLYCEIDAEP